jgi:nucleoside-diphosphate-sugar epimerase
MRVFIAGATGVLGRRVVDRLNQSNHSVVALSRSQANREWLANHGAEARSGDLFDRESLYELTADCDAILHLATAIPTKSRSTLADWQMNDRVRRQGTQNLVGAAVRHQCRLYLQESVALIYGEQNGGWVDEQTPIPQQQPAILQSAVDMERFVREAARQHDLPAIILRFGSFYGHDSAQTRLMLQMISKGLFPIVRDGQMYWNLINADDAAAAVVAAVEKYEAGSGQTFNVCDDEPVQYGTMVRFIADALRARTPMRIPRTVAKVALGAHVVEAIFASFRCRNQLIKETLGWTPTYNTYREGYPAEIAKWRSSE